MLEIRHEIRQQLEHLKAIQVLHSQIQQDDVRGRLPAEIGDLARVGGRDQVLVSCRLENVTK